MITNHIAVGVRRRSKSRMTKTKMEQIVAMVLTMLFFVYADSDVVLYALWCFVEISSFVILATLVLGRFGVPLNRVIRLFKRD